MRDKDKDLNQQKKKTNHNLRLVKGSKSEAEDGRKPDATEEKKKGALRLGEMMELEKDEEAEDGRKPDASGEKKKGNLRLREMLDLEEDEEAWEEEEEEGDERPWMTAVTFLGLAVLAAIICVILWYFTHPDKTSDGGQNLSSNVSGASEAGDDSSGGQQAGNAGNSDSEQVPGDEGDSVPGQTGEAGGDASSGQTTGEDGQSGQDMVQTPGTQEEPTDQGEIAESEENPEGQDQEPVAGTTAMKFTEQQESVTPKDVVNLRSAPTTTDEETIVVQCHNGEILTRTGINQDTGWSQIDYGGRTLYAVTQYLTTNLDYKPPVQAADPNRVSTASGRVIVFSNCDDWISPKEYVNLRTEPSTDEGNDTVSCRLNYGEKAHRTGYSADSGWSRVEYDGKVLYVVTSLIYVVESD